MNFLDFNGQNGYSQNVFTAEGQLVSVPVVVVEPELASSFIQQIRGNHAVQKDSRKILVHKLLEPEICMICLEPSRTQSWCCRQPVHKQCMQRWVDVVMENGGKTACCPMRCTGPIFPEKIWTRQRRRKSCKKS